MKAVLQTILCIIAILTMSPAAFAQEHCNGICQMARAYDDLFSRYEGWGGAKPRPAVARSECGEIFGAEPTGRTCSGCKNHEQHNCAPFRMIETAVSGVDSRIDDKGNLRPEALLTPQENLKFNGVGILVCPQTLPKASTVSLVRKDENGLVFMGSAHGVIPSQDETSLTVDQLKGKFRNYISGCEIIIFDKFGNEVERYQANADRAVIGTFKPTSVPRYDFVAFAAEPMSTPKIDLQPLRLVPAKDLNYFQYGKLICYHHDIKPQGVKVKSVGRVKTLEPNTRFKFPGIVGHDMDTNGACSGGSIVNEDDEVFAIHLGGTIAPGKDADWKDNSNIAAPLTPEIIRAINEI